MLSSNPVSEINCDTDQLPLPKTKLDGLKDTPLVSLSVTLNVTSPVGSLVNTTLKLSAIVPFSLTVAVFFDRLKPAVSLSVVVTVTVGAVNPL